MKLFYRSHVLRRKTCATGTTKFCIGICYNFKRAPNHFVFIINGAQIDHIHGGLVNHNCLIIFEYKVLLFVYFFHWDDFKIILKTTTTSWVNEYSQCQIFLFLNVLQLFDLDLCLLGYFYSKRFSIWRAYRFQLWTAGNDKFFYLEGLNSCSGSWKIPSHNF